MQDEFETQRENWDAERKILDEKIEKQSTKHTTFNSKLIKQIKDSCAIKKSSIPFEIRKPLERDQPIHEKREQTKAVEINVEKTKNPPTKLTGQDDNLEKREDSENDPDQGDN